ncbi:MAG: hypothetical protein QXX36_02395 [Candidatus Rehaiarchaeum fermentans]|nr:hypothetical protein [Candidatus Rehaiarchaeum fermentans]
MSNNTVKVKEFTKNLEYIINNLKAVNLNKNEAIIGSLGFSIINKNKESIESALNSKDVDLVHPLENDLSSNEIKGIINKYNNKKSVTLLIVNEIPTSLDIYYKQTFSPVINLNEKIQIARNDYFSYNASIYTIQVFPGIVGPIKIMKDDLENIIIFNETEVKVLKIDSLMATFMNPYASPNGIISDRFIKGIILGIENPNDLINKENKIGNLFFDVGKRVGDAYNYVNEIRTITKNLVYEDIISLLNGKVNEKYYTQDHYMRKLHAQNNSARDRIGKLWKILEKRYGILLYPDEIKYLLNEYFTGVSEGIRKD